MFPLFLPQHLRQGLPFLHKADGERIHAMAGIFLRKSFSDEDVPEMPAAMVAEDLGAAAVGVGLAAHGPGDLIIKAGPAAAGVELVGGAVQRMVAAAADEGAAYFVPVVFAGKGHLRAFVDDNALFFGGEWVVGHEVLLRKQVRSQEVVRAIGSMYIPYCVYPPSL